MNEYNTPILELIRIGATDIITDSPGDGTETPPIPGDGNWEL